MYVERGHADRKSSDVRIGGGATMSTMVAGLVADHLGVGAAFLSLAVVGLSATVFVWTVVPETRSA